MSTPTSVEQLCNIVLTRIGYPERIGNIYDGTKQARAALDLYAETRDDLLRKKNWPFAFQQAAGASSGTPPVGWAYSWSYPTGCIRIRSVSPSSGLPSLDPQPLLWELYNNGTTRYVVTQVTPITINFTGQVVDMTQWEPGFVEALIQTMALRLAPLLRKMGEQAIDPEKAIDTAIMAGELQTPESVAMPEPRQRQQ
jgi:hypothetical protein